MMSRVGRAHHRLPHRERRPVTGAHDETSAVFASCQADVDAVVLDLMLPGMSGPEVCQQLRREGNNFQILMLTAREAVAERGSRPHGRVLVPR
jgi:two-component system, OmpR family, response regulator